MVKKYILLFVAVFCAGLVFAQVQNPVVWTFTAKKIADKTYELHMTATISGKFHIYAQDNSTDGPVPTTFTFTKSPLFTLQGKVKENGKLISKLEPVFGVKVNYFENKVDFVQVVKSKVSSPATVKGTVNYMVCDDKKCLPPKDLNFEIKIGGD